MRRGDLKRVPLRELKNRKVRLTRTLKNGYAEFPVGTEMFIVDKWKGFSLGFEPNHYRIRCISEADFEFCG